MNNKLDNISKYLFNKKVLDKIISILESKNINEEQFIDIINNIAELIRFNNETSYSNLFLLLADKTVEIIELYNIEDEEIKENNIKSRVEELKPIIYKLINDIRTNIEINIYFAGNDKYNILTKLSKYKIKRASDFSYIRNSDIEKYEINILIVSEETIDNNSDFEKDYDDIIYYDKTMNKLFNISEKIYYGNYDYYYLLKSLELSISKEVENIVVGNSYPLTGIDTNLLESKSINLSLSSQDLYYSYKLAKLAIDNNVNIKRCIIGVGYYLVNHDLSKSKNEDAINRVKNVYYPILKDKHNSDEVSDIEIFTIKRILKDDAIGFIFDLDFLDNYFKNLIYTHNNGYFNDNFTREKNNMLGTIKLSELCEEQKYKYGEIRANQHNKLCKYTETSNQYKHIFNEFVDFLISNNVEPIVVVFPNTKYYRKYLNKKYEYEFYKIIDEITERTKIKVIDLCKQEYFIEEDFIDFDHMSRIGAVKTTKIINKYLNNR